MMNSMCVFLSTKTKHFSNERDTGTVYFHRNPLSTIIGDFCLTPIRYLFDGEIVKVTFNSKNEIVKAKDSKEFKVENKSFLRTIASIILLAPGLIIGIAFKS